MAGNGYYTPILFYIIERGFVKLVLSNKCLRLFEIWDDLYNLVKNVDLLRLQV